MASKGSNKELSVRHEDYVARCYSGGVRSKSSGAAVTDAGDVRSKTSLIECKCKRGSKAMVPVKSTIVKLMEKIASEAWAEDRDPVLALRFYCPESILASQDGWVDLAVRQLADDVARDYYIIEERERWR